MLQGRFLISRVRCISNTHLICLSIFAVVCCTICRRHLQVCNADRTALIALTPCRCKETICGLHHSPSLEYNSWPLLMLIPSRIARWCLQVLHMGHCHELEPYRQ